MLDERGREIPDSKPMVHPLGLSVQETLADKIKRMVRYELSRQAEAQGHESFEDADDFDVGDEPELKSPYELDDGQLMERVDNGNGGKNQGEKAELRAGSKADGGGDRDAEEGSKSSPGDGERSGSRDRGAGSNPG